MVPSSPSVPQLRFMCLRPPFFHPLTVFLGSGYMLANVPGVQENIHVLMLALIVLTLLPTFIPAIRARFSAEGRKRQVLP